MRRTYRINPETLECEEITGRPEEWRNGGTRYGSEELERMRKAGLVTPGEMQQSWAEHAAEKERVHRLGNGDLSQLKSDAASAARKRELAARIESYRGENYKHAPFRRRRDG